MGPRQDTAGTTGPCGPAADARRSASSAHAHWTHDRQPRLFVIVFFRVTRSAPRQARHYATTSDPRSERQNTSTAAAHHAPLRRRLCARTPTAGPCDQSARNPRAPPLALHAQAAHLDEFALITPHTCGGNRPRNKPRRHRESSRDTPHFVEQPRICDSNDNRQEEGGPLPAEPARDSTTSASRAALEPVSVF